MKFIYQGDIHLRDKPPANRVDDYQSTMWDKLKQLVEFTHKYDADLLLGGDLYDSFRVPIRTVYQSLIILGACKKKVYSAVGQHDIPYHNLDIDSSPLSILLHIGIVDRIETGKGIDIGPSTVLHIVNWEQEPSTPVPGKFNIFLGHVSVFEGEVPFYWKGPGFTPKTLRKKYPGFDLYLCGDIHKPVVDRNVVVSGSMMRMSIDQIDYRPRCYLIDTNTLEITPLYYEIKEDVFSIPDAKFKDTLELDSLVMAMKMGAFGKDSFKRDCLTLSEERPKVKEIIQEIFDGLS